MRRPHDVPLSRQALAKLPQQFVHAPVSFAAQDAHGTGLFRTRIFRGRLFSNEIELLGFSRERTMKPIGHVSEKVLPIFVS
jgi:hypothetical protein